VVERPPEPPPEKSAYAPPAEPTNEPVFLPPLDDPGEIAPLSGFETNLGGIDRDLGMPVPGQDTLLGIERTSVGGDFDSSALGGMSRPDDGGMFTTFDVADHAAAEDTIERPAHDLALPGELPLLELPDFGSGDIGTEIPLIMPDDPMPPRRASKEILAELDAPVERDSIEPPLIELTGFDFDIQKDNSAFLTADVEAEAPPEPPLATAPATAPAAPSGPRRPSGGSSLAESVEALSAQLAQREGDSALRRRLGEALLERGERERGLQELEMAMIGFERSADYESARSVADEIIRLDPNSVRHHQKRVQYAFQANDTPRLVEAYLELADALFRGGQGDKAHTVYQRVLELAPNDIRAQAALSAFVDSAPAPPPPSPSNTGAFRRYSANTKRASSPAPAPPKPARPVRVEQNADEFVNLGDMLRDDEVPKSTRMVVEEQAPSGDEQADFADMLKRFKRGIAENVDEEDHQSHYDLGVAFKEMGLLDEAIGEFQKALRASEQRVRTYEALGQCFMERSQFDVAVTILERAVADGKVGDEQLVGVLYLLGYASEALDRYEDALTYYQRVFAVDIQFRDVAERIRALERVAQ
jgi:tetratricopeptide (TPR) repeat protein